MIFAALEKAPFRKTAGAKEGGIFSMTNLLEHSEMLSILVPKPPAGIPEAVQQEWRLVYDATFRSARDQYPDDFETQQRTALSEANKLLLTPEINSYDEAMSLEPWHFVLREPSADGKALRIVTRHGRKMILPIPGK